ncbi:MAG: hypothetical protein KC589_08595 [Nanoarchaeota archaeon]|nr:hypothetical protein [Nanoarchaeota archaeon]
MNNKSNNPQIDIGIILILITITLMFLNLGSISSNIAIGILGISLIASSNFKLD